MGFHNGPGSHSTPIHESLLTEWHEPFQQDVASNKHSRINPPRRRLKPKFTTIQTEQNIGKDFAMTKFDSNLTIEKTKVETHLLHPNHDMLLPSSSPPHDLLHQPASPTNYATSNSITPSISSTGIHTPSSTYSVGLAIKTDRSSRTAKKRSRAPPISGSATPTEVFHRNLVDAVSNVEDSDENEQYVYPYAGTYNDHACYLSDSIYRPQSLRSTPASPLEPALSWRFNPLTSNFFSDLFRSNHHQASLADQAENATQQHRPKLRSLVVDHYPKSGQRGDHLDQHHWYDKHANKRTPPSVTVTSTTTTLPSLPLIKTGLSTSLYQSSGYSSDDEGAPLLMRRMKRRKNANGHTCGPRLFCNTIIVIILLAILSVAIVLYRAKPLTDIAVEIGRVLASDKELIFDLHVTANNWNWWSIRVSDADVSVFAFSNVVPLGNDTESHGVDPAEYLGSFYRFDESLLFPSTLFSRKPMEAVSQIRIKSPGTDKSGNGRWSHIIRYQYGLVIRGVIKYHSLPFGGLYPQSSAVSDVAHVDPSGNISAYPYQNFT